MRKTHLFVLNSFAVLALVSCGAKGYTHTKSSEIRHYSADLNHDGKIEKFKKMIENEEVEIDEENLTWAEAYDTLITEASSTKLLNQFADEMGIAEGEPQRTYLARYEIMHEAEELLMSTAATIPLYNYADPYLLKPNVSGIYSCGMGYKFFDQLKGNANNKYTFVVGTCANSFDPAVNDDNSTAVALSNMFAGLCKWQKDEQEIEGQSRTYNAHVTENTDILLKFEHKLNIESNAVYTIELKHDLKFTNTNKPITAENFIASWNRAASAFTGQWTSMFKDIAGYEEWKEKSAKLVEEGKKSGEVNFIENGMSGLKLDKDNKYKFTIELINDCSYFKDLLAFPAFFPLDIETVQNCEKNGDVWWLNPSTFGTNGRFTVGELKNNEGGYIKLVKDKNYPAPGNEPTTTEELTLLFLDSDSAMWDKYKSNAVDMIDSISNSLIDTVKKERPNEWRLAPLIGNYYFIHNVNDNTFDLRANESETNRENLRKAFNLLLNRYDFTETIVKSGATDASGMVSTGIIEQCVPGKRDTNGKLWCARKPNGATEFNPDNPEHTTVEGIKQFELVYADWHERNLDMSQYWNTNSSKYGQKYGYKDHWLEHRTKGGFYDTVVDTGKTQEECQKANVAKAIELAKSAGVKYNGTVEDGTFENFPRITITTNTGTGHESLCERMQAYLSAFNIEVKIETQEWNSFNVTRKNGSFAVARCGWTADYSDCLTYLDIFLSTGDNNDTQLGKDSFHKSK